MARNTKKNETQGGGVEKSTRLKLDPRLSFLLALTAGERLALKDQEDQKIRELGKQIRGLVYAKEDPAKDYDEEQRSRELAELERRVFAPITTGLYLSGSSNDKKHWPTDLDEDFVSAFVLSDASAADLTKLGVRIRSKAGDIFIAFVPVSLIPKLETLISVRYIELARPLFPTLSKAIPYTQIDSLWTAPSSVTGAGAIVGICDDLLDIYHPDFRTATGTRIRHLWVQELVAGPGEISPSVSGFTPLGGTAYGVEYSATDINSQFSAFNISGQPAYSIVRHGGEPRAHGTHVTGIAVGNGTAPSAPPIHGISCGPELSPLTGAAPEAEIIFVSHPNLISTDRLSDSTFVGDAFAYIFARAELVGRPCVINLSDTDNQGPHDGSLLGEQFLDNLLLTPGRAITVSAGNRNNTFSHASGQVSVATPAELVLTYSAPPTTFHHVNDDIEIWYDGHDKFDVTLNIPTEPPIGPVSPGMFLQTILANGVTVAITSVLDDPRNHDNFISIILTVPVNENLPPGAWTITLAGATVINGAFHAWVDRNNQGYSTFEPPHLQEDTLTVGVPASARRVITVGNHDKVMPPGLSDESGRGPTRDGRVKPEIATVGTNVWSAASRNMNNANSGTFCYTKKSGTSMAAPLVAGACALLFQCRGPAATWANLKQILEDTATTSGVVPPPPNDGFGFGFLQVGAACNPSPMSADVWLKDDPMDSGLEPYTGAVAWLSPDIEVLDMTGSPVANPTHNPATRFSNRIRVTVRNRGTQTARNTEVYLYWADPATNIPFPGAWNTTGIFAGPAPGFVNLSNMMVIKELPAGSFSQVEFAWSTPSTGTNISGDDHFCLLARVENESDPSGVGTGGWVPIVASNNIALRNVHVKSLAETGVAETQFHVVGSGDTDSLIIQPQLFGGKVSLTIPVQALPWRDLGMLEKLKARRPYFGCVDLKDPLASVVTTLKGEEVGMRTDITGAERLELRSGIATITLISTDGPQLHVPYLRLRGGARLPASIQVQGKTSEKSQNVHVGQLSGGQRIGGITLKLS